MTTPQTPTPSEEKFRKRLRCEREREGMTQAELGKRCGLTGAQISFFETGQRLPSFGNLVKLTEALRVTAGHLIGTEA